MSLRSSLANSVFRGIGAGASAAATPKKTDDMTQEEKDRRARNKKAGRAEDDDGETDAQRAERETAEAAQADTDRRARNKAAGRDEDDDEGDDDDDDKKKDKEDDEDEEALRKGSKSRADRLAERARCAAILGHPAARGREDAAGNLAFNTNTPRHQAVALLASMPKAAPPAPAAGLHSRQQGQENRSAGAGGVPLTGQAKAVAEADAIWSRVAISPNAKRA